MNTPDISLSTYWLSPQYRDGYALAREAADLGFQSLTLASGIRFELIPGIIRAIAENIIKVDVVYNMGPLPPGVRLSEYKNYTPLSFFQSRRQRWVKLTEKTIQLAHDVGASTVVLDLGNAPFLFRDPVSALRNMKQGRTSVELMQDIAYQKFLHRVLKRVQKGTLPLLRKARESMYSVLGFALDKNIRIGIENRRHVTGLPLEEDVTAFFNSFNLDKQVLGYWYNTGHGKVKEQMGLLKPVEHLKRNKSHLMGFCFNDVNADGRHRQPLGFGAVDFDELMPFVRSHHTITLEISRHSKVEDVKESKEYLEELLTSI